jgi:uncharacterized membrane protein YoaK (UPF0700 family)
VLSNIRQTDTWLSFGLAFVGGYGDAASFVLAKTFTGHVTGNLVLTAIAVAARPRFHDRFTNVRTSEMGIN